MSVEKKRAGDALSISASEWNNIADATAAVKRMAKLTGVEGVRGSDSATSFLVKNNTGATVERFGVMGVDSPIYGPNNNLNEFKSKLALVGVVPTFANNIGRWCIALEPIAAGKIGRCRLAGVEVAKVSVANTAHTYAEILDSNTAKLGSAVTGSAKILWKESGLGDKWAVVQMNADFGIVFFELASVLHLGGSATANVLVWDIGSATFIANGATITVGDPTIDSGFQFGGPVGFRGAATMTKGGAPGVHEILWLENYARVIEATLTTAMTSSQAAASVNTYTQGRQPPSSVLLTDVIEIYNGWPIGAQVVAVLDDIASSANDWATIVYVIVDAAAAMHLKAGCLTNAEAQSTNEIKPVKTLKVRKNSSLQLLQTVADQTEGVIDIKRGSASNTVFSSRQREGENDNSPKWDSSPELHSLTASSWLKVGHIYLVRPTGALLEQTWELPNTLPSCKARLYAENVGDNKVQLGWEAPGLTIDGYMYFHRTDESCDDVECRHVSFVRGQLISIENEQGTAAQCSTPQITTTRPNPEEPCAQ